MEAGCAVGGCGGDVTTQTSNLKTEQDGGGLVGLKVKVRVVTY